MNTIKRMENFGLLRQRMIIKNFKTADSMHKFLNSKYDNSWSEYFGDEKKTGTYAFLAGKWTNIKDVDSSCLAHC